MIDLHAESDRIALMDSAGCDPLMCGLTFSVPRSGEGPSTLTHHRRPRPEGLVKPEEMAVAEHEVTSTCNADDLLAWIREQHPEPD